MYNDMDGSIYAMLDAGMSIEEIKAEVDRIAAEHAAEERELEIEDARSSMAAAFCYYLEVLGIINTDESYDEWRETCEMVKNYFKEFEENALALTTMLNKSKKEKEAAVPAADITPKFDDELRRLVEILSNIEK